MQAVWLKEANAGPTGPFLGHATILRDDLRDVVRTAYQKYPNLKQVFFASRIYAGYASTSLNPEPYAYESGFSVRWVIEAQINDNDSLNFEPANGVVNAPWLAWGPYLWADGETPRQGDSLQWFCPDFSQEDGTHPATSGRSKVSVLLEDFFKTSPHTVPWFLKTDAASCECPCANDPVCDGVRSDVLDVVETVNVAFRGSAGVSDPSCPHERTDVDCSGGTDVVDVVRVTDIAFRAGDPVLLYCDPCAP